ncbi:MAG TPA: hypothetical protein ENI23_01375 [bacterium]|nr:hypothetical protein [bacterium]
MGINEAKTLIEAISTIVPKTTPIGTSILLMDINEAVRFFPNQPRSRILKIFKCLQIPLIYDRDRISFNLYTFEKVMHYLTRPGGAGIALFGSTYREATRFDNRANNREDNVLLEIGDKELKEINSAIVESERLASGPKASSSARLAYITALKECEKKNKTKNKTKNKEKGKTVTP